MALLQYMSAALMLTLLSAANAQQQCTECPLEIDSVCNGPICAAVCVGGSCEVFIKEACKLENAQGQGVSGHLKRVSSQVENGRCLYKTPSSEPIPYEIKK